MNRLMPTFCGISIDTGSVIIGSLVYSGPSLSHGGDCIAVPAPKTIEIIGSCLESSDYVHANSIAMHMPDMPEGCFVALNKEGLCGSMYAEHDKSGCIIYILTYHDGGIKSKIIYSSFHKNGYTNNLCNCIPHTATELHGATLLGQYTGKKSIELTLSAIGAKK
ncbi:MAG: hypothetical protein WCW84_06730 [Sulfurimonas sp.]|jgi:hypothetical protein